MKKASWLQQLTHWLIVVMVTVSLVGCWPSGSVVVNANPGDQMDKIKVTISLDDAHLEQIDQVTKQLQEAGLEVEQTDRKSTRLNSSHLVISYAVFCLKKKKQPPPPPPLHPSTHSPSTSFFLPT